MIGSGKTTLGERLAARMRRPFVDLDREVNHELGYSFHRLVAERGWLAFREVEYAIVKGIAAMRDVVAALGGGTVRYAWNVDALRGTGAIVLLEAAATLTYRTDALRTPEDDAAALAALVAPFL
jgi:shikimate kinase